MSDFADSVGNNASCEWYSFDGPEHDVVLSTRVRLARNVAQFPFPEKLRGDDMARVRDVVFDSFSQCRTPDLYKKIVISDFNALDILILNERGIIDSAAPSRGMGVVLRVDGRLSCVINDRDHIRISSFLPGLDLLSAYELCSDVDEQLQENMQFAASYDFGFLTSRLSDCGTGMKVSCRVHLPSLSFSDDRNDVLLSIDERGVVVKNCFGAGTLSPSSSGFFYTVATKNAEMESAREQLAVLISAVQYLAGQERHERECILKKKQTALLDRMHRSYAIMKSASLVSFAEAVEILSDMKWGKALGFFSGIEDSELCALLYHLRNGHLQLALKSRNFAFPDDIAGNTDLQIKNLRALLLQEAFGNIKVS